MSVAPDAVPLEEELADVEDRVNALPSVVVERGAALRWSLERVDLDKCDAFTTASTPAFDPDVPIECKAVRVTHNGGAEIGRLGVHPGSHRALRDDRGWYAIALYREVDVDGDRAILVLEFDLVPAEEVGRWIRSDASDYQKVRWDLVLDVDREDVLEERDRA